MMETALARSSSRPRPSSRPTTPLRPNSRSSIREAHGYGTSISNAGYTQPAINALEPQFAELADSMADLEANFMHLQLMHESLTRFSESFASFLYGLNMNAFCVDFPEQIHFGEPNKLKPKKRLKLKKFDELLTLRQRSSSSRAVTFVTMASITSASVLSEAEFGCEHLAAILTQSGNTAEQFKSSFLKTHNALAPRPLPLFPKPLTVDDLPKQKGGLRTASLLRPKYTCLTCSEVCAPADRPAHTKETGHHFWGVLCSAKVAVTSSMTMTWNVFDRYLMECIKVRILSILISFNLLKNNANKRACAKQGVRGLYNLGQTCYLNVILQTLLHDPILNAYFLGNGHQSHDCTLQDCIGCAVAEAFADFNSCDKAEGFAALNLLLASWRASSTLAGYHQQDAHEYYQFLVDKLHTSTEGHVDDHDQGCSCFFHQTFYGKLKSSVKCDNCGNITKTEDPMLDLSLDVQVQAKKRAMGGGVGPSATPTLNGCLESFTSPERLMAGVYNCSECGGTPQKATKRLRIKKLPAILCMQLKRFEHSSAVSEKVEGRVDFPLSINMLPYTTHRHREDLDKSKFIYDLSSAVVHKGKLDAGHYYVYCKQGDQWVLFNDDQVTAATEAEVLNADAYLLFYNLRLFTASLQ
ncbi:hypothetical protein CNMCM6805_008583 [Aspergillus fumigatiaffinis]|uniref:USP domain-containing protein n=1 Tax=Aspergillus fumigatiaffinis TaxID=340414 RepID=A0A8H4H3L8_9EURO|nr:hypothetical protein CNMCM6805_008583 [Aspergillus fumigatiaffinis]